MLFIASAVDNIKTFTLKIDGDYSFIGVRSSSGQIKIDSICFVYGVAETKETVSGTNSLYK